MEHILTRTYVQVAVLIHVSEGNIWILLLTSITTSTKNSVRGLRSDIPDHNCTPTYSYGVGRTAAALCVHIVYFCIYTYYTYWIYSVTIWYHAFWTLCQCTLSMHTLYVWTSQQTHAVNKAVYRIACMSNFLKSWNTFHWSRVVALTMLLPWLLILLFMRHIRVFP